MRKLYVIADDADRSPHRGHLLQRHRERPRARTGCGRRRRGGGRRGPPPPHRGARTRAQPRGVPRLDVDGGGGGSPEALMTASSGGIESSQASTGEPGESLRAAVTFATTEHFTLQAARSTSVTEASSRG